METLLLGLAVFLFFQTALATYTISLTMDKIDNPRHILLDGQRCDNIFGGGCDHKFIICLDYPNQSVHDDQNQCRIIGPLEQDLESTKLIKTELEQKKMILKVLVLDDDPNRDDVVDNMAGVIEIAKVRVRDQKQANMQTVTYYLQGKNTELAVSIAVFCTEGWVGRNCECPKGHPRECEIVKAKDDGSKNGQGGHSIRLVVILVAIFGSLLVVSVCVGLLFFALRRRNISHVTPKPAELSQDDQLSAGLSPSRQKLAGMPPDGQQLTKQTPSDKLKAKQQVIPLPAIPGAESHIYCQIDEVLRSGSWEKSTDRPGGPYPYVHDGVSAKEEFERPPPEEHILANNISERLSDYMTPIANARVKDDKTEKPDTDVDTDTSANDKSERDSDYETPIANVVEPAVDTSEEHRSRVYEKPLAGYNLKGKHGYMALAKKHAMARDDFEKRYVNVLAEMLPEYRSVTESSYMTPIAAVYVPDEDNLEEQDRHTYEQV